MAKLDIQTLAVGEIQTRLNDAREELMKLRFQQATGELTDFTRLSQTRRLIARLLTALNERAEREGEE
jgi:large subunit ribosomal protein L29